MHIRRLLDCSLLAMSLSTALAAQCEIAGLKASDGAPLDAFASAVALDGNRAVIGAAQPLTFASPLFAAYVFEETTHGWVETARIEGSGGPASAFGSAVALAGDVIAIGAPLDDDAAGDAGAVHVFELAGGIWVQTAKLLPPGAPGLLSFGTSVALQADRMVVGAPGSSVSTAHGAAYVFERSPGGWTLTDTLLASDGAAGDRFGFAVAQSGGTIAVGAPSDDHVTNDAGSVYLFEDGPAGWLQTKKLISSSPDQLRSFGRAVAMDGDVAVVGEPGGFAIGEAHVIERVGADWLLTETFAAPVPAMSDAFGESVDVDGNRVIIGAPGTDDACPASGSCNSGSAHVFEDSMGTWGATAVLTGAPMVKFSIYGAAVSLSGNRALIGAPGESGLFGPALQGRTSLVALRAGFESYGQGLAGLGDAPLLRGRGCPAAGQPIALEVSGGPPGAPGILGISTGEAAVPFAGGEILITLPATGSHYVLDGNGEVGFALAMPHDPALMGLTLYLQAGHADASAPAGVALTAGLRATFG